MPGFAQLSQQQRQRSIEHLGYVAGRHLVPEEVLRLPQLFVHGTRHREFHEVLLWRERPDGRGRRRLNTCLDFSRVRRGAHSIRDPLVRSFSLVDRPGGGLIVACGLC